jgi:hypothetical protein
MFTSQRDAPPRFQRDAPPRFQLGAERAIDVFPDAADSALEAALGNVAAWQAEWLPSGQRVLLEVTAEAARVLDATTLPESSRATSVFEAWMPVTDAGVAATLLLGDVLLLDGEDVRAENLTVRRRLLEHQVRGRGLVLAGYAAPGLADIVRAPSWRTVGIAYRQAPQHGAAGLVFRCREGHYGGQPLVRWPLPAWQSD